MTILIVDDEEPIRELIKYNVEREGFSALTAATGAEALHIAGSARPDAIVLDLMLPDMNGFDVCRTLKRNEKTAAIPILMVTAKTEDIDIVSGLELGADDYITKPFSPKVLTARIRSVLRRRDMQTAAATGQPDCIQVHHIQIFPQKHDVIVDGKNVVFSAVEFAILTLLAENPGRVFSRQEIITAVKGESYPVTDRAVDVQILSIRRKLGGSETDSVIETIRGVGYRLREA